MVSEFKRGLMFAIFAILSGCLFFSCNPSVRDIEVYSAEIAFLESAASEQVVRGIALIQKECECVNIAGVRGFASGECQALAETTLVLQYRMAYHTAFMRYLGGLDKRRPPKHPPEIPSTATLCPEKKYKIEEIDPDYPMEYVVDAGVAGEEGVL